jgi:hypothetical protein
MPTKSTKTKAKPSPVVEAAVEDVIATSKNGNGETDAERKQREETARREKRGAGIAAMQCVKHIGNQYVVSEPNLRGDPVVHTVERGDDKIIRCNCEEYEVGSISDPTFRCSHKWAVVKAVEQGSVVEVTEGAAVAVAQHDAPAPVYDNNFIETEETIVTMAKPQAADETAEQHAPTTASFDEKFKALTAAIPSHLIRQREGHYDKRAGRRTVLDYVEWHTVVERLNAIYGGDWTLETDWIANTPIPVCSVTIGIVTGDGNVIKRSGVGCGADWNELGIKRAESDGIKRAAVKFGVAIELYKKEDIEGAHGAELEDGAPPPSRPAPQNNAPRQNQAGTARPQSGNYGGQGGGNGGGEVRKPSEKQMNYYLSLCNDAGEDPEEYALVQCQKGVDALSSKEMSTLIDGLR